MTSSASVLVMAPGENHMTDPSCEKGAHGRPDGLGLAGLTSNAMALIAPGAFLWISLQMQSGLRHQWVHQSLGWDMWPGVLLAIIVAFTTAVPYAQLAGKYPEAGCGGAYYFAQASFRDSKLKFLKPYGRFAKLYIGFSSHIFYWIYPGTMVAFMAILVEYVITHFDLRADPDICQTEPDLKPTTVCRPMDPEFSLPNPAWRVLTAALTSFAIGLISSKGVSGSTLMAHLINAVQLTCLVAASILFLLFRCEDPLGIDSGRTPGLSWAYPDAIEVLEPFSLFGVLMQASVSILILVGFDSCTSLSGEAKNPGRDVPRAVLLSLGIQGPDGMERGFRAAALSSAPFGDLVEIAAEQAVGDGFGERFMNVIALSVLMAVFGSILAAAGTAVRFSEAMAIDGELPQLFAVTNGAGMPTYGVWLSAGVNFIIGSLGSLGGVTTLTAVTLTSNLGTLALYVGVCITTIVSFYGKEDFHFIWHFVFPAIGCVAKIALVFVIVVIGGTSGGETGKSTIEAIGLLAALSVLVPCALRYAGTHKAKQKDGHLESHQSSSSETCDETTELTTQTSTRTQTQTSTSATGTCMIS
eukprot:TRINITY_DN18770_c0_g1_i1.p1 TRINITY_DN18770_c0_g1~~TRINITY_DN18770_c0_g1_i1.p1  ORF type:complete len:583 (+),score=72.86 TRINITY_DN18770_c0_g1_i1:40-1788(+)